MVYLKLININLEIIQHTNWSHSVFEPVLSVWLSSEFPLFRQEIASCLTVDVANTTCGKQQGNNQKTCVNCQCLDVVVHLEISAHWEHGCQICVGNSTSWWQKWIINNDMLLSHVIIFESLESIAIRLHIQILFYLVEVACGIQVTVFDCVEVAFVWCWVIIWEHKHIESVVLIVTGLNFKQIMLDTKHERKGTNLSSSDRCGYLPNWIQSTIQYLVIFQKSL